jgi:multidrug resistance efflux pump
MRIGPDADDKSLPPRSLSAQLADAAIAVESANAHLQRMQQAYAEANKDECAARNRANEAQKNFDRLVGLVKKPAPRGSDWWEEARADK